MQATFATLRGFSSDALTLMRWIFSNWVSTDSLFVSRRPSPCWQKQCSMPRPTVPPWHDSLHCLRPSAWCNSRHDSVKDRQNKENIFFGRHAARNSILMGQIWPRKLVEPGCISTWACRRGFFCRTAVSPCISQLFRSKPLV